MQAIPAQPQSVFFYVQESLTFLSYKIVMFGNIKIRKLLKIGVILYLIDNYKYTQLTNCVDSDAV